MSCRTSCRASTALARSEFEKTVRIGELWRVAAPSPTTQAWDVSHGGRFAEEALVTRHGGGSGGVRPATTGGGWLWAPQARRKACIRRPAARLCREPRYCVRSVRREHNRSGRERGVGGWKRGGGALAAIDTTEYLRRVDAAVEK